MADRLFQGGSRVQACLRLSLPSKKIKWQFADCINLQAYVRLVANCLGCPLPEHLSVPISPDLWYRSIPKSWSPSWPILRVWLHVFLPALQLEQWFQRGRMCCTLGRRGSELWGRWLCPDKDSFWVSLRVSALWILTTLQRAGRSPTTKTLPAPKASGGPVKRVGQQGQGYSEATGLKEG